MAPGPGWLAKWAMTVQAAPQIWGETIMPLHFGKVFAAIALLTVAAFILWLLWGDIFEGETGDDPAAFYSAPGLNAPTGA